MLFQFISRIEVSNENMSLAKRVMLEKNPAPIRHDVVLGKDVLWNGDTVQVQLRHPGSENPSLTVSVLSPDGRLKTYQDYAAYDTGFEMRNGVEEYVVCLVPENQTVH